MAPTDPFHDLPVLVTGAAGFIGSHLSEALVARGARVRALDDFSTGKRDNLAGCRDAIELIEADIRDPQACRQACADVALVFHQAALGSVPRSMADPAATIAVNVTGTANVFTAARDAGIRRVVYASSSSVYGDSDELPKREGREGLPLSPYALSKRLDEELAAVFSRCFGLELVGLRYFNVYGPRQDPWGQYAAVIPRFVAAHLAGEAPHVYGDGRQSRDFTFVGDAVSANLLAAAAPADACGVYNVATGRETTLLQLEGLVRAVTGGRRQPQFLAPRPGDVRRSRAAVERAAENLGFRAEVSLQEGLRATLGEWPSAEP
ncbi:MAG TPA: NAD-dependent epimerase/dehydratase family protein [Thermoanaerobaculia bacterium]|nr:NAD-dependent epimerase/dehydratase family protein [Thermoanaerobaculia bacterium]